MTLTTGTAESLLTPEQVEDLLIKPVLAASRRPQPVVLPRAATDCPSVRLTAERVVTAVRRDAEVKADKRVFTSDRVAVRVTCRVGFGFPHPAALVRIRLSAS